MIRRPPRSTHCISSAASDVYKRQVSTQSTWGKWIMAAEITETTRLFGRCVARIEADWIEKVGAHLIKRQYFDPHWEKKSMQVAGWERTTLYGIVINPKRRIHYGPLAPAEAKRSRGRLQQQGKREK
eukprot:TRINITY_DN6770_c0_g1_i5.p2 TRINITY_DN6770_c0_g1~~TRINITY_DN6770_c0_g1_i5.p2  ORF type:complete len:127 (+),score=40.30 TRINITY_DN6770_c0_g1_i5:120-500(+)